MSNINVLLLYSVEQYGKIRREFFFKLHMLPGVTHPFTWGEISIWSFFHCFFFTISSFSWWVHSISFQIKWRNREKILEYLLNILMKLFFPCLFYIVWFSSTCHEPRFPKAYICLWKVKDRYYSRFVNCTRTIHGATLSKCLSKHFSIIHSLRENILWEHLIREKKQYTLTC